MITNINKKKYRKKNNYYSTFKKYYNQIDILIAKIINRLANQEFKLILPDKSNRMAVLDGMKMEDNRTNKDVKIMIKKCSKPLANTPCIPFIACEGVD